MIVDQCRWQYIRLRRHGTSPLRFMGTKLHGQAGRASVIAAPVCVWHEVGLYVTAAQTFVVEIVGWAQDCHAHERRVRCHALEFDSLELALKALESHDPTADCCPETLIPRLSDVRQASHSNVGGLLLLSRISMSQRQNYGSLIGQFLYIISNKNPHLW